MLTRAPGLALRVLVNGQQVIPQGVAALAKGVLKALRKARPMALLRASLMALYWGLR